MKRFQDLTIQGQAGDLQRFLDELGRNGGDWTRAVRSEEEINRGEGGRYVALSPPDRLGLKPATLFLYQDAEQKAVTVANIIPRDASLSEEEYNEIVRSFYDDFVVKGRERYHLQSELTKDEVSADDVLSEKNVTQLRQFSNAANKSTGSSHPLDQRRWFSFICSTFNENEVMDSSILRGLLIEHGWPEEKAQELASEYEFGVDLLRAYTGK